MRLLLPVNDAATSLGVGRTKIYELIADGQIELVKIGRKSLVPKASLEQFVSKLCDGDR